MKDYSQLADIKTLETTKIALEKNGFQVIIAETPQEAKSKLLQLIPEGSQVMTNTSRTLEDIGAKEIIDHSGRYISLHEEVLHMDRTTQEKRIKEIRSVPDYAVGSFHAVTTDGKIMMASGSGSQIPGYAYGATKVIFVAGTHKIVKDMEEGFNRINNYSLPLESKRINKVYKTTSGSNPRRILIMNSEADTKRTTVIFIKKNLGF